MSTEGYDEQAVGEYIKNQENETSDADERSVDLGQKGAGKKYEKISEFCCRCTYRCEHYKNFCHKNPQKQRFF